MLIYTSMDLGAILSLGVRFHIIHEGNVKA